MADHFYGVKVPGGNLGLGAVDFATSTTAADNVELRVKDGVSGLDKTQVLMALEAIQAYISTANAPA